MAGIPLGCAEHSEFAFAENATLALAMQSKFHYNVLIVSFFGISATKTAWTSFLGF
jgi:hypothetical protein